MLAGASNQETRNAAPHAHFIAAALRGLAGAAAAVLPVRWGLTAKLERFASPPVHGVDFGALRRLRPVSNLYGWDRGTPVDRYYIEKFLDGHREAIRGRVLEISENTYTKKFGAGRVTGSDVLHYNDPAPPVTIVADLTNAPEIEDNSYDCIIITQTMMMIYDYKAAVETIHRILKPGGTVLATMAGLTQIADPPWRDSWYWGFTKGSATRIFNDTFTDGQVEVQVYGNVLSTISFLQGLAAEELTKSELDFGDPDYQMLIGVAATKTSVD